MTIDATAAVTDPIDVSTIGAPRQAAGPADGSTLDRQAFLELLVAQLRYQDPTSPMDSTQLMTQTNQLAQTEALQELVAAQREAFALQMRTTAASLVGLEVSWKGEDGASVTGVVDSVSYASAVPTVRVGDVDVPLDSVASVANSTKGN